MSDQAITHAIASQKLPITIFTLDTGRQFQESYELMDLTKKKYDLDLFTYFPAHEKTEKLVREKGYNSFYSSIDNRKECCFIRKMEPLARALAGVTIWITGLRAEQSENRAHMPMVEWDEARNLMKVNPIIDWSFEKLNAYLKVIAKAAGIDRNVFMHLARHTFATTVTLSQGISIEAVSKMLGHKNLRTTQHYAKVLDRKVSEDMKILKDKFTMNLTMTKTSVHS